MTEAQRDEMMLGLVARGLAQDMLLRRLWTAWLSGNPNPQGALFAEIESLIGSLDPKDEKHNFPAELRAPVESELRFFMEQVKVRLEGLKK
jgi:hypothetical protein